MAWYCIVFDIIAVYCMSPHCILWYGMVLYFIWSYCTVSHCYVPLLQRAGELPRSASSHFIYDANLPREKLQISLGLSYPPKWLESSFQKKPEKRVEMLVVPGTH